MKSKRGMKQSLVRKINSHSFSNVEKFGGMDRWYYFMVANGIGKDGYKVSRYVKKHLIGRIEEIYRMGIKDPKKLKDKYRYEDGYSDVDNRIEQQLMDSKQ